MENDLLEVEISGLPQEKTTPEFYTKMGRDFGGVFLGTDDDKLSFTIHKDKKPNFDDFIKSYHEGVEIKYPKKLKEP